VEGRGCADLFALAAENPAEYLSASHTRSRSTGSSLRSDSGSSEPPATHAAVRGGPHAGRARLLFAACAPPGMPRITSPDTRRAPRTSTPRSGCSGCGVPSPPSR
jgi:hypothetical protein